MVGIIDAAKRLFSDKENKIIFVYLFILSTIISVLGTYFELVKKPGLIVTLVLLIIYAAVTIYFSGYNIKFLNRVYHGNEQLLPEFDKEPFGIFWKVLPLAIIWIIYTLIYGLTALIPIAGWLFLPLFIPFISYIFVAFSKHYETNGLYNILLPFTYIKKAFNDTWITLLKYIVLLLLTFIPLIIITIIFLLISGMNKAFTYYSTSIIAGYVMILLSFIWQICIVEIYKEKIEETPEVCEL